MSIRILLLALILAFAACQPEPGPAKSKTESKPSEVTANVGADPGPAPAGASAEDFLKWSMAKYRSLASYECDAEVTISTSGQSGSPQKRHLRYRASGPFRAETESNGFRMTSVSDGKKLVEYASVGGGAREYPAPANISLADSMQMKHPMFCGTMLYYFFGGPEAFGRLVSDRKPVAFGKAVDLPDGGRAKVVTFYGKETFGNTSIAIDEQTGLVHRIEYDSAGLVELMKQMDMEKMAKEAGEKLPPAALDIKPFPTVEVYSKIKVGEEIAAAAFDTNPPAGIDAQPTPPMQAMDKPPVELGSPAPNLDLVDLGGKPLKLSSLRGKVVLIDFWATWCGPCRIGLPKTQQLHDAYKDKGLAVLTVSAEDAPTIEKFIKENKYTFPAYRDPDGKGNRAYGITGIPTMAILDAKGNLSAFMVGLQDEEEVKRQLEKAGLAL